MPTTSSATPATSSGRPEDLLDHALRTRSSSTSPPETTATSNGRALPHSHGGDRPPPRTPPPTRPGASLARGPAPRRRLPLHRPPPRLPPPPPRSRTSVRDALDEPPARLPHPGPRPPRPPRNPRGPLALADFQVDAAANILRDLDRPRNSRGTIVGAGTGSGKTLAFYLPAFLHIARRIEETPDEDLGQGRRHLPPQRAPQGPTLRRRRDRPRARRRPRTPPPDHPSGPTTATRRSTPTPGPSASGQGGGGATPAMGSCVPTSGAREGEPLTWRDEDIEAGTERLVGRDGRGRAHRLRPRRRPPHARRRASRAPPTSSSRRRR